MYSKRYTGHECRVDKLTFTCADHYCCHGYNIGSDIDFGGGKGSGGCYNNGTGHGEGFGNTNGNCNEQGNGYGRGCDCGGNGDINRVDWRHL